MAITDKKTGPWGLDQVYNKINQGSIWEYSSTLNNLYAWGQNDGGELAQNNRTKYSSPVQIPGNTWVGMPIDGSTNDGVSWAAVRADGTLWTWGSNVEGQLGQNQAPAQLGATSSPVQIPGTTWSEVQNARDANMAIKTDGTLWTWGKNEEGQNGVNNRTSYSSPVQIPGTTWDKISCGSRNAAATKTDGTLWWWGENTAGQVGDNSRTTRSSPTQIPGTTWSRPISAEGWSLGVKTDGTLWIWGYNQFGNLGQNNKTNYSSPVQIPGTTWSSVFGKLSGQLHYTTAIKTDGTLWSWGYNENSGGNLGQNNKVKYSSPVQIPGTTWKYVTGSDYQTHATKTDGTLWSWGKNQYGQLGVNNQTAYSSPVQVGSDTTWGYVGSGKGFTLGFKMV